MKSVQANLGGNEHPPARHRATTPRELPSGSILPFESPFERNGVSQALLDIGALGFIAFLLSLLAVAVPLSGYVLLFVR